MQVETIAAIEREAVIQRAIEWRISLNVSGHMEQGTRQAALMQAVDRLLRVGSAVETQQQR